MSEQEEEKYNYMGPLQKNEIPKFCGIYSKNNNPHNNLKAQEFRKNLFKKLGSLKWLIFISIQNYIKFKFHKILYLIFKNFKF